MPVHRTFLLLGRILLADFHTGTLDVLSVYLGVLAVVVALPAFFRGLRRLKDLGLGPARWNLGAGLLGAGMGVSLLVLSVQKAREEAARLH